MQENRHHSATDDAGNAAIMPGGTIGILGGGQLGRMTALAARRMGFRIHILDPEPTCPSAPVADATTCAEFNDADAIARFATECDVVTLEFENIDVAAVRAAASVRPVRPSPDVLHVCQNREREKCFLYDHAFPHAPFAVASDANEVLAAVEMLGLPCVLKTADFGYDGKGQQRIESLGEVRAAWESLDARRGVVETWVPFVKEISVVCARGLDGSTACFPVAENLHSRHILDLSILPARIAPPIAEEASELAVAIASTLEVVGLLTVEMFLLENGQILVNELAPRPHNSGHFSFDACVTSQFEQHARAVSGLPLGSTDLLCAAVMWNLLGDLWEAGEPDWRTILANPRAKLHLYGKMEAKARRKMGHVCFLAGTVEDALHQAEETRSRFSKS